MLQRWGLGALLGAGLATLTGAQGAANFDGQYMGELTLTGIIDGDCTRPPPGALYPLEVAGRRVRFSYVPRFSTTLSGSVAPNGSFTAAARAKSGMVQMTGQIRGDTVTAEIVSPSCKYSFKTKG